MRKLLNTLFITTPQCYLSLDGNNVVVLKNKETLFRIPICNLEGIVCFNYLGASPKLMQYCTDNNIYISFMTPDGRYLAGIFGKIKGNVLLRKRQYLMSENDNFSLEVSKNIIAAKLYNCRFEINKTIRDNTETINYVKLKNVSSNLKETILKVLACHSFDQLRGIEGDAARLYFSIFNEMIIKQKKDFVFNGRTKRPPLDFVNAMLSFGYSLLAHDVAAALQSVGLDPYVGFYHTDRPGRISLALDIMEEFRAILVDRFVLTLINLRQIKKTDFIKKESNSIILTDAGRKLFLTEWQKKKQVIIKHPFIGERIKVGLLPYVQALILSRFLRGEINDYVPYFKR